MNQDELLQFLKENPRPFSFKELKEKTNSTGNLGVKLNQLEKYGKVRHLERGMWVYCDAPIKKVEREPPRSKQIVAFLKEHGEASSAEIYQKFDTDKNHCETTLLQLEKQGRIQKRIETKNGRKFPIWSATWKE